MEVIITILVVILIIIAVIAIAVVAIKSKINSVSREYLGMNSSEAMKMIGDGLKNEAFLPKPISALNSVYVPKIQRDFPEIGYTGMEAIAHNGLLSCLNAIEAKSVISLEKCSQRLYGQVENIVKDNESRGISVFYDDVKIHKSGISAYKNTNKEAQADFEISMQYIYYAVKDSKVVDGSKEKPTQVVYKVILTYNQEEYLESSSVVFSSNCPNCGAPVSAIGGEKCCPYCGSGLREIADRVWQMSAFKIIK